MIGDQLSALSNDFDSRHAQRNGVSDLMDAWIAAGSGTLGPVYPGGIWVRVATIRIRVAAIRADR